MKKTLILSGIILFSLSLFSQNNGDKLSFYLQNFQYAKALEYIDTQPPTKELIEQKAFCYRSLGNYKEAVILLDSLSAQYPDNVRLKTDLATCYDNMGKLQQSIDCYNDLIAIDSTNAYFKIQKADLLFRKSNYAEALDMYKILYNDYNFGNGIKRSAQCFEKMNLADSAMHYYGLAWERDSTDRFSAANLINLNLKSGHSGNGILLSDIYLSRDTTDKQINLLNGLSYYMADLYEEAITRLEKCYNDGDTSVIVNRSLGLSYYSLNDSYRAMKYLDAAFRQDTTNNNVLYCLAVSCNEMAEPERAVTYFHKLLDRTIPPDLTLYLYYRNLALAYSKINKYQEAIDYYDKAISYGGDNQQMNLYFTIGDIYIKRLDNKKKALDYFERYRISIDGYLDKIRKDPETEEKEIKDTLYKIKSLDEYIVNLKKEAAKP